VLITSDRSVSCTVKCSGELRCRIEEYTVFVVFAVPFYSVVCNACFTFLVLSFCCKCCNTDCKLHCLCKSCMLILSKGIINAFHMLAIK
jgi:hypothetical protein